MMRRLLLAGVAVTVASAAHGQGIPTIDVQAIAQRAWQQVETLGEWTAQARSMATQISQLNAQLSQARAAYAAVTGVRDLGSAMSALNMVGIQNPLPIDPYALQGIISGNGGISGVSSNLGNLFTNNVATNRLYDGGGGDWRSQDMRANANGLAGIQAIAQQSFQAASAAMAQLAGFRARLAIATDPKEVQDLTAAMAITQAGIASQQQMVQSAGMMAAAQPAIRVQRDEENERRCIDKLIAYYSKKAASAECGPPVPTAPTGPYVNASYSTSTATEAGSSSALTTMLSRDWGQAAADNATRLGVNPTALAGTCVMESNCQNAPPREGSTIRGAFQMTAGTYQAAAQRAGIGTDLAGQMNPAIQSAAAAQELKSAALALQQRGIANPTLLDTRALYQWGAGAGPALAQATGNTAMSDALPGYSDAVLRSNGITPGVTTVQDWRNGIIRKVGPDANKPVLLSQGAA